MEIFDWEEFRKEHARRDPLRETVIKKAWKQWVDGHDSFEDKSSAEMEDYFNTFRSGWLVAEFFCKNG